MTDERTISTVEIDGYAFVLDSPQAFYEAVNLLHTSALDGLHEYRLSPVVEALECAKERLALIEGVKP